MKTAKGIKGVRKFLAEGAYREGWHVFMDGEYLHFSPNNAYRIAEILTKSTRMEITLAEIIGNGLWFASKGA